MTLHCGSESYIAVVPAGIVLCCAVVVALWNALMSTQWQQLQQQQQQRRGGDVGLAMLFDGQKRRASESGLDRAQKKSYFHKAD